MSVVRSHDPEIDARKALPMTVLPPGLIAPPEHHGTVVVIDRSAAPARADRSSAPGWSARGVAFVLLVAFTFVVLAITVADVANG